jgi:hypothetical protein
LQAFNTSAEHSRKDIPMSRQRFVFLHSSPIFLLSLWAFCVPFTWAQGIPLTEPTSVQLAQRVTFLGDAPEAQTRLFAPGKDMPPRFTPNLGLTQAQVRFIVRGTGYDYVLPTNQPVVKLSAEANYWNASLPTRWLANVPDNAHPRTALPHNLQYYGLRFPFVGQTIVRLAQVADSHPRAAQILRLFIQTRNTTSSGAPRAGAPRIRGNF